MSTSHNKVLASPSLREIIAQQRVMIDFALERENGPGGGLVIDANGDIVREVKNLGWLVRHADDVRHPLQGVGFTVKGWRYGKAAPMVTSLSGRIHPAHATPIIRHSPVLLAHLADGRTYTCVFADARVMLEWLDRPSFRGYTVHMDLSPSGVHDVGATCAIGGDDYMRHVYALKAENRRRAYERELAAQNMDRNAPSVQQLREQVWSADLAGDRIALRTALDREQDMSAAVANFLGIDH